MCTFTTKESMYTYVVTVHWSPSREHYKVFGEHPRFRAFLTLSGPVDWTGRQKRIPKGVDDTHLLLICFRLKIDADRYVIGCAKVILNKSGRGFFLSNIVFNVRLGFETDTMEGLVRIEGIAGMGMEVTEKGLEVNHTVFGSDHS